MKRWLYHYDSVHGAPEVLERLLRRDVRDLLRSVTGGAGAELTPEGDLLLRLPAHLLGLDVHKTVRLHTGVAERRGPRTVIPLRWHAEPGRHVFAGFDGTIELDPQSATTAHLAIVGAATLPLGPVGAAADATVLGAVADRTIAHLTERLADALERAAVEPQIEEEPPRDGLRVRDVMTPSPLVLHDDMPLKTAALLLFHFDIAGAPVRGDTGGLIGVLSEADLMDIEAPPRYGLSRASEESRRRKAARTVGEACSRPAREVTATAPVRRAAELMRDHDVARLIVVDGSEVVGVISRHDVLRTLVRSDVEIQAALDRLLADGDEDDDVTGIIDWGVAHLSGRASTRSRVGELIERVEDLDGVIAVYSDLTWAVDDIVPPVTM